MEEMRTLGATNLEFARKSLMRAVAPGSVVLFRKESDEGLRTQMRKKAKRHKAIKYCAFLIDSDEELDALTTPLEDPKLVGVFKLIDSNLFPLPFNFLLIGVRALSSASMSLSLLFLKG